MLRTKIESKYRVTIPKSLRPDLKVGDELIISTDKEGRIILTPQAPHIISILQKTAGMWRGRQDVPADGVDYVNSLRQGRRLQDLGIQPDGD